MQLQATWHPVACAQRPERAWLGCLCCDQPFCAHSGGGRVLLGQVAGISPLQHVIACHMHPNFSDRFRGRLLPHMVSQERGCSVSSLSLALASCSSFLHPGAQDGSPSFSLSSALPDPPLLTAQAWLPLPLVPFAPPGLWLPQHLHLHQPCLGNTRDCTSGVGAVILHRTCDRHCGSRAQHLCPLADCGLL